MCFSNSKNESNKTKSDNPTKNNAFRHWEKIWQNPPLSLKCYHRWLSRTYKFIIQSFRVLELGCGVGDLLASLEPEYGVRHRFLLLQFKRPSFHLNFVLKSLMVGSRVRCG